MSNSTRRRFPFLMAASTCPPRRWISFLGVDPMAPDGGRHRFPRPPGVGRRAVGHHGGVRPFALALAVAGALVALALAATAPSGAGAQSSGACLGDPTAAGVPEQPGPRRWCGAGGARR